MRLMGSKDNLASQLRLHVQRLGLCRVVIINHPECLSSNGMHYIHSNLGNQRGMQNGRKNRVIERVKITAVFLLLLEKSSIKIQWAANFLNHQQNI